ncbi:hypothetical protein BTVI_11742 [Pitangus sulphuratus]|nr:hypothetical protein BTVI_11742 [Pitangus sulphuratus]
MRKLRLFSLEKRRLHGYLTAAFHYLKGAYGEAREGLFIGNCNVAAPDLLDPKSATQNSKPRLSFSTKPTVLASREENDSAINVMKWKTVSTIFLVVVVYLIIGATVFKALEQPHETSQRTTIVIQKQTFVSQHSCVNATELDELIQVPEDPIEEMRHEAYDKLQTPEADLPVDGVFKAMKNDIKDF